MGIKIGMNRTVFDLAHGTERNRQVHVVPISDEWHHKASVNCWCKPRVDSLSIYVHNSKDGREREEKLHGKKCSQGWNVIDVYGSSPHATNI